MKYLSKIEELLNNWEVLYKGCSFPQIELIEKKINNKLPLCYREFLENFGYDMDRKNENSRGGFVGESIFFDSVYGDFTNKHGLVDQLKEDGKEELLQQIENDNIFVFVNHQGYIFAFFKLDESDNPPVYGYNEGQERNYFPKLTNSLSDFFEQYLEQGKDPYNELDE